MRSISVRQFVLIYNCYRLRTEYSKEPFGINQQLSILQWSVKGTERNNLLVSHFYGFTVLHS